ncbi:hypothetical protein QBZ16_000917 [Prototheca wickerhamii]|uniref:Uncharacterized protein n=1 Tax=Prototheca wickerhamii TaxID=3111 RepID=A0AAD9IHT6_PROWI|nr:hypothetical protein QBZ16_000917 [Prototheca wickerhamii]
MPSPVFRAVSQRSRAQAAKRVNNVQRYLASVPESAPNPFEIGRVTPELVQRHKLGVPAATSALPRREQPDPRAEDGLADSLNGVLAARERGQSTPAAAQALENLARAREAARLAAASSSNPFEVKRPSVRQAEEARPAEENPFLRNVSAEKLQSYARDLKQAAPADGQSKKKSYWKPDNGSGQDRHRRVF